MKDAIFLKGLPFNASIEEFVEAAAAHMMERGIAKYKDLYENDKIKPQGFKDVMHKIVDMIDDKVVIDRLGESSRVQKMKLRSQLDDLRTENPDFFKFFAGVCYDWNDRNALWKYSIDGGSLSACFGAGWGINRETGVSKDSGYPNYLLYMSLGGVARNETDEDQDQFFLDLTDLDVAKIENGYEFNVISVNNGEPSKHRMKIEFVCETEGDSGMYQHIIAGNTTFYKLRENLSLYVNDHGWATFNNLGGVSIHNEMNEGSEKENYELAIEWLDSNGFFRDGEKLTYAEARKATREYGESEIKEMLSEKNVDKSISRSPIIKELDAFLHIQAKSYFKSCCLHFPIWESKSLDYREIPLPTGMERAFNLQKHRHAMNIVVGNNFFTVRIEPTAFNYIYLCKEPYEGNFMNGYKAALEWCLNRGFIDVDERTMMERLDLEKYNNVSYEVKCPWNNVRVRGVSARPIEEDDEEVVYDLDDDLL